ncbi:hypothetical protein BO86DRAFT_418524 [Aspergillus japonicus CBS 114.51]|uniref:PBP domain-containing protein n=1 Tax=Aspergillus japonicus CBS 114.51 TaxID=1448312 RepID=A0A8T8X2R8_ASPJA|nr:hypothetical protein BO86DRAFT_418524 [Aspergillus japonicus CBS 114.51]RAH82366.1 hypothetical protein BO86DRAFT_418524 [Aspergillus japonicus CBS 114.51]
MLTLLHPASPYHSRNSATDVNLRIGNGGAGKSGLIRITLTNAFIKSSVKNGSAAFKPAWYKSNTTESIHYRPVWYAWRDHFMLTGPHSNTAQLSKTSDILTMFSSLYTAAKNRIGPVRTRFLPRYDKSATSIKESDPWIGIGQLRCSSPAVPWTAYSTWYHHYIAYPFQALTAAILLEKDLQRQTTIYKTATGTSSDFLLNPAHIINGNMATNAEVAHSFAQWVISNKGQAIITGFEKYGQQLYTGAPANKTAHLQDLLANEGLLRKRFDCSGHLLQTVLRATSTYPS